MAENTVKEEDLKRSYFILVVFCVLLWSPSGCSTDVDGMMPFVPDAGLFEEDETDKNAPVPNPGGGNEADQPVPDPVDVIDGDDDITGQKDKPGTEEENEDKEPESEGEDDPGEGEGGEKDEEFPEPEKEPEPESAVFLSCTVVSEAEILFEFSDSVTLLSLVFNPAMEISSVEEGSIVKVYLEDALLPGQRLMAGILAEDERGNIIDIQIPILFKNIWFPALLINELRTEFSKLNAEYIEFKMISAGNLGGLRVFAAWLNKNSMIYEFPPVEVEAGEYVVLHLRKLEESCRDELGINLDESGGTYSCPTARDLWIPGSSKLLHKTDAVYVMDQDDQVLDAVMLSETPDSSWNKSYFEEAAMFLFEQGAWKSPLGGVCAPIDAVSSANVKTALTRSICRDETMDDTNTAADWYVTTTGGITPGLPNNPKRFE